MASATIDPADLLEAVEQATEEYEAWLGAIGSDYIDGVGETPHPFSGMGCPAGDIAQVIFHGATYHAKQVAAFKKRKLRTLAGLPWPTHRRISDDISAEIHPYFETDSERARTVAALRRAEKDGWVGRNSPEGAARAYWIITQDGEEKLHEDDDMPRKTYKFDPDWVVAPGETLDEWFTEIGLPKPVAATFGIDADTLNGVLAGTTEIDAELAQKLCNMTHIGAPFWLALEHNFRVGLAAGKTWSSAPA